MKPDSIALALLTHEPAGSASLMRKHWLDLTSPDHCVIAYGGRRDEFDKIEGDKVFIDDPRLRTKDHQRELQSYSGVMAGIRDTLANKDWEWLCFAEFDTLPLSKNILTQLITDAKNEQADLLAPNMYRVDHTLYPHYTAHAAIPGWLDWLRSISLRENPQAVIYSLGCLQLWKRECFEKVVETGEPIPTYLELLFPTVAHHLGFRVRSWNTHENFVSPDPLPNFTIEAFRKAHALVAHPVKGYWTAAASR